MGTFTININEDPTIVSGAEISSMSIQPGSVKFTISGGTVADDITVGIKAINTLTDGTNTYYAAMAGTDFAFTPSNSNVEITDVLTHTTEPKTYTLVFYDNPNTHAVLVEVRLISSTGTLSSLNQYDFIAYNYFS